MNGEGGEKREPRVVVCLGGPDRNTGSDRSCRITKPNKKKIHGENTNQ